MNYFSVIPSVSLAAATDGSQLQIAPRFGYKSSTGRFA